MTREEMIEEIRRLDAAYDDIDISEYSNYRLEHLLDWIETDEGNPNNECYKE
jgi:hypothetical protein